MMATDHVPARARLHISVKVLAFVGYFGLCLALHDAARITALAGLLVLATGILRRPWHAWVVPLLALIFAGSTFIISDSFWQAVVLGVGRLLCMTQLIALLGAIASVTEIARLCASRVPGIRSVAYILGTMLAVLPSVQRDLRKSLDVVALRRGRRMLWWPTDWGAVLADTLVRATVRSRGLAESSADRGFRLATGLTALPYQRFRLWDIIAATLLLVPVAAAVFVPVGLVSLGGVPL
jgi:energy-coupling factor transporter transmembrane protein EcfT